MLFCVVQISISGCPNLYNCNTVFSDLNLLRGQQPKIITVNKAKTMLSGCVRSTNYSQTLLNILMRALLFAKELRHV